MVKDDSFNRKQEGLLKVIAFDFDMISRLILNIRIYIFILFFVIIMLKILAVINMKYVIKKLIFGS